jgi:hypothetical protein
MMDRAGRLRFAWVAIVIADLGVLLYGFLAAVAPDELIAGYESYTDVAWADLAAPPD